MNLKTKLVAICSLVVVTLCLTLTIGYAFSNPKVSVNSPVSFKTANGVGATVVASVTNNGVVVDINGDENGTEKTISISADSAQETYNLDIPEQVFSAKNTSIVYTFTITNTSDRAFKVTESHIDPTNTDQCTVSCNFVNSNAQMLNKDGSVTITYTITLLSESANLDYSPNFSFTLS